MSKTLAFRVDPLSGPSETLAFTAARLVIAGWAGRDAAAVRHHIDELAAIGIAPPSRTPLFYAAAASLLTQDAVVDMLGPDSSGEVEPLLLVSARGIMIGVGSDHTDRQAEAWSVPHSKQLCAKPVAATLWPFADVAAHWDRLILRAWIPGADGGWTLYQEGGVDALRRPEDLMAMAGDLSTGTAMLCGTLGAIGGIRPAAAFRIELHDPVLGRAITHRYDVQALPVVV
jgi:hypothetical protein